MHSEREVVELRYREFEELSSLFLTQLSTYNAAKMAYAVRTIWQRTFFAQKTNNSVQS